MYYNAWEYLVENKFELYSDYPYVSASGSCGACTCTYNESQGVMNTVRQGFYPYQMICTDVPSIQKALEQQPNSVAINASSFVF